MAFLGLLGIALLLLPLLSLVRSIELRRDLKELRERLDAMERRIAARAERPRREAAVPRPAVDTTAGLPPPVEPGSRPMPPLEPPVMHLPAPEAQPRTERDLAGAIATGIQEFDLEQRIGGRWLQHAGLLVLLFGVAFFLRYAFDHAWLSPSIRVALGAVAGAAMMAGGLRLSRRYRAYGLLLAGGGIAILYLSVYAGLNLYELFGTQVAFGLLLAITIVAAGLADRTDSQPIALAAVCGGFASPFLVGGTRDEQLRLFSYVALLVAATMYLAHRRRWPWLNVASLALTTVTVLAWAAEYYTDATYLRTELFLTLYCAMFVDILRRSAARDSESPIANPESPIPNPQSLSWRMSKQNAPLVASLLFAPVAYHVWSVVTLAPHGLAFLIYLIAFTAITVMLGVYHQSSLVRAAAWIAVALPLGSWIEAHHWRGWVFTSVAAIAGVYVMHLAAQVRASANDEDLDARDIGVLHANGVGVYVALYQVLTDTLSVAELAGLALLLGTVNAAIWMSLRRAAPLRALHWLGVAFTLVAVAVWVQFGGPWAVAIWATEGAVVFWTALTFRRPWLRAGAWALLAMAVFRWLQPDIQQTTTSYVVLVNARALTGMYVIALLYLAASLASRDRGAHGNTEERAALIVGASVMTLIVMSTEIMSFWQRRTASTDAYVAREMMLSASWVLYAAVLVAAGMKTRYAPIRYFAIVLFGVALLKIFLVDLETLGGIYRVAGFLVVGLILLVVSFLYQRNAVAARLKGSD